MTRSLIKLALTLALLLALFHLSNISLVGIFDRLRNFRYVVVAALLPLTLIPWVAASRWGYLLGLSGIKERMTVLWGLNWKAAFLGFFLPGSQGLDFFRILFIERRHPGSRGVAGSTVVIERMIGFMLLGLFALLALSFVYEEERFRPVLVLVLAIDGGLFLLLSAVFLVRWKAPAPGGSRIARTVGLALQYLHRLHQAVQRFPYRLGLLPTVLWIAVFQLSLVTVVHLLFLAFDQPVPFVQNLLLYPLIGMLTVVPLTVSGFGVREGAFVFFYSLVGIPAEVAVGVSLLTYLLVIGIPSLLGGLLLLFDRDGQTRIPRR